jgi:dihydroorotate dehydrogenase electron transfer subunit
MAEPQCFEATLVDNAGLAPSEFLLRFRGCEALAEARPGQFVMLRGSDWGSDPLLPRAFSLLAVRAGGVADILVKAVGRATALMQRAPVGARFRILGPLGNWFPEPSPDRLDWLIAGGVGLAPLLMYATRAQAQGVADCVTLFYGGRTGDDLVLLEEAAATGASVVLVTEDGSRGEKGLVTAAVDRALDAGFGTGAGDRPPTLFACGPEPMLRAVASIAHSRELPAYLSLEGEMACGVGACLACAVPCATRPYRYACVEGPVFPLAELAGPYLPKSGAEARS